MSREIGDVEELDLVINQGADLVFDMTWWADDAETVPVPLSAASGAARGTAIDGTVVELLFAGYVTIAAGSNKASVRVPAAITAALQPYTGGLWDFFLHASSGEKRKVVRGSSRCEKDVAGG